MINRKSIVNSPDARLRQFNRMPISAVDLQFCVLNKLMPVQESLQLKVSLKVKFHLGIIISPTLSLSFSVSLSDTHTHTHTHTHSHKCQQLDKKVCMFQCMFGSTFVFLYRGQWETLKW